ncbi:MAG: FMN-binding protein [Nitrospiraceae bacterium]
MFSHITRRLPTIGLLACLTVCGLPALAQADRIWDSELKRYLTEQEMSHAEVFLSEEEAVKLAFPKSDSLTTETHHLTPAQKAAIEERIGWKFPEETFTVIVARSGAHLDGYALVQNTIGKHKPMTYLVASDEHGQCTAVELLVFREARGSEVRTKRFNVQYEGKTVADPIRINKDIINISGATMSVRSMSAGVKRALVLIDELYLKPQGVGSDRVAAKKSDKGFFGTLFGN